MKPTFIVRSVEEEDGGGRGAELLRRSELRVW